MLGVSGLRGIVGKSLTPEVAARYAAAFAGWLLGRAGYPVRVCVGSDGRAGGDDIKEAAMNGLTAAGAGVSDLGVVATPTVGFTTTEYGFDGGMVVTASHNPQEWNGLKCIVADPNSDARQRGRGASAPNAVQAAEIIARFRDGPRQSSTPPGRVEPLPGATDSHLGHMFMSYLWLGEPEGRRADRLGYRVVLDSVNGAGRFGGSELLASFLGCELIHHGAEPGGLFPHPPEPTKENLESLCSAVTKFGAQVGFAQDPDADRLAIVDEKGEYIGEEYTLALACEAILRGLREKGIVDADGRKVDVGAQTVLVTNLSTSRMIDDIAARYGARVVRTPVGEANVVEAMKREKAAGHDVVLGGEGSPTCGTRCRRWPSSCRSWPARARP
jgi:phosphomannomutase